MKPSIYAFQDTEVPGLTISQLVLPSGYPHSPYLLQVVVKLTQLGLLLDSPTLLPLRI
jgi:hypothetical protein